MTHILAGCKTALGQGILCSSFNAGTQNGRVDYFQWRLAAVVFPALSVWKVLSADDFNLEVRRRWAVIGQTQQVQGTLWFRVEMSKERQ